MARPTGSAKEAGKRTPNPLDVARLPQPKVKDSAKCGRSVPAQSPRPHRSPTTTTPRLMTIPDTGGVAAPAARARTDAQKPASPKTPVTNAAPDSLANTTQTRKPPLQRSVYSLSSISEALEDSQSRTSTRSRESLDKQLRDRLQLLRLSRVEVSHNKNIVKELREKILNELLKSSHHRLYAWETMNSGSYYDKTKISRPNEYDCMFTCQVRAECIYHPSSPSKSYAGLRILTSSNWQPSELLSNCDDDKVFICPRAFKAYFRQHVETALCRLCSAPTGKTFAIRRENGDGPAVTIDVKDAGTSGVVLSVDLVPAVRLLEWPTPAKHWTSCWLPPEIIDSIKKPEDHASMKPFVVPKIHPTEYDAAKGHCKWWRLSFSAVEKKIVKHADGIYSTEGQTCRKNILRLLKEDLEKFYANNRSYDKDKKICSYFMKTIVLRLWEEEQSWASTDLVPRYMNALERTVKCLENKSIEHFFIKSENLLNEKEIPEDELNAVKNYFSDILTNYSHWRRSL